MVHHAIGRLAQLVRALRLHRRCQGFESLSDHMKRLLVPIILVLFIIGGFYNYLSSQQFVDYPRKQACLGSHKLTLILTDTEQRKITGLSGSKPLNENEGMLFQFPAPGRYGFWMKDMSYALDFIYLNNNVVVELVENVSPNTYPNIIIPEKKFNSAIEVKAGLVNKKKIQIGDKLVYN